MGDTLNLTIPADLKGERLDKALASMLGVSRAVARGLVDEGVKVDGQPAEADTRVVPGARVETPVPPGSEILKPEPVEFGILYEDDDVLVVDKPAGLIVHPGSGQKYGTLAAGLLHRYPEIAGVGARDRWGLVHRLDKDTTGAILVARNRQAFEALTAGLRARRVRREYLTLVEGVLKPPTGTIDAPIGRDPRTPTRRAVSRQGKSARTHYQVVSNFESGDAALVEVTLETGRTHQIRVHFAAIGHPVVGDVAYGSNRSPIHTPRIFLHARRISFDHPGSGAGIVVDSPLPDDLAQVLAHLEGVEDA